MMLQFGFREPWLPVVAS